MLVSAKVGAHTRDTETDSQMRYEIEVEKCENKREAGKFASSYFFLSQTSVGNLVLPYYSIVYLYSILNFKLKPLLISLKLKLGRIAYYVIRVMRIKDKGDIDKFK